MWKRLLPQLNARLRFAVIGCVTCLLFAGALELLFNGVDMQGTLTDLSARSLLFDVGAVRRSTRERLKTGDIQITLRWHNVDDLDLVCEDPFGERITYMNMRADSGGELDLDMNADDAKVVSEPVENIHWPRNSAPKGRYTVYVNFFKRRDRNGPTDYDVTVLANGRRQHFEGVALRPQTKQLVAAFNVEHGPRTFLGIHLGILYAGLVVGGWFGLMAALLALALIGAENVWYRRHYHKPILETSVAARRVGIAFVVVFGWAAVSQLIFGVLANHFPTLFVAALRLIGLILCFTMIGKQFGRLVPNFPVKITPKISLITGWIAGIVFLLGMQFGAEMLGRLFGAGLFGFVMGFLICLIWVEEEAPVKKSTPMLSLPPMRLQPYRMTSNQIDPVDRQTPETGAPKGRKTPTYPHEKPV